VHEVRPRVDRAKATVTVKVAFVDPADGVLPDMGAKVTFLAKELETAEARAGPVLAVQPEALADRGENKVLWVVDQGSTVKNVPVVTGPPLGNLVSLKSGPPPGTRVVLRPPPDLKPGMKVKEKQS
jgi:multidrug efflux pump subunit AcrA (membrane-fusion protein)